MAEEFGGAEKWGYLRSKGVSYTAGKGRVKGNGRGEDWLREGRGSRVDVVGEGSDLVDGGDWPEWLRRSEGDELEIIGEDGSVAQVWV